VSPPTALASDEGIRSRAIAARKWAQNNVPAAVTLVGLVLYGSLGLSARLFYGRLGFRPEEVGLG
jgi:hypothetical protein